MKTFVLYLVIVEIATGKLYQKIFHPIILNEKELKPHSTQRIYGGENAAEKQFPFMVFVVSQILNSEKSCCSGTIIHKDWILISAHCIDYKGVRPENIILAGGKAVLTDYLLDRLHSPFHKIIPESAYGVQERRAKNFYLHPRRTPNLTHDIGLIKLAKRFTLKRIREIKLSSLEIKAPTKCTILGWGMSSGNSTDGKLKFIKDKTVSTPKLGCLHKYLGPFICIKPAGGGICQGDSGSPMVCNNTVVGVASYLVSTVQSPTCGTSSEEYYSAIYPELGWIRTTIKNNGMMKQSNILSLKFFLALIIIML